eukprot:1059697-Pyramimonas_sp.AAC.1
MVGTIYMHVGEGLTPRNLTLMRGPGEAALAHRVPFCIGGGWNNTPHAISHSVSVHILDGIVRGDELAPSYVLDDHGTTIDYYLISRTLDTMVEKAKPGDQKVRIAKRCRTPPGTRVIGHLFPDPD